MAGSGSSGGGSGGGLSGANKVVMLLAGGTVAGLIGWFIWPDGGDGNDPVATPVVTAVATREAEPGGQDSVVTVAPATTVAQPSGFDRKAVTEGYPDGALLTITAFGMPARVGATVDDHENNLLTSGMFVAHDPALACYPDQLYPDPCIYYWLVKPGTNVTVSAGDSRAGYWPVLEAVHGPGCELNGADAGGRDLTCTLTLAADVQLVATYYGDFGEKVTYPTCPTVREAPQSAWEERCQ